MQQHPRLLELVMEVLAQCFRKSARGDALFEGFGVFVGLLSRLKCVTVPWTLLHANALKHHSQSGAVLIAVLRWWGATKVAACSGLAP